MAYARRTPGSASRPKYTRRGAARKLQRTYRKKRATRPRSSVVANAKAISSLRTSQVGHLQTSYEVAAMDFSYTLQKQYPMAFCLNDFTSFVAGSTGNATGGQIYTPAYIGSAPTITLANNIAGNWTKRNPGFVAGLDDPYQQWQDQNRNTLNLFNTGIQQQLNTSYLPVYADYSFTFTRDNQDSDQSDIWLRFDEISPKKIYSRALVGSTTKHIYDMPQCLGAFQNMANRNNGKTQNAYNPSLWYVKTRWVKLPATEGASQQTKFVTHRMKCTFPKKSLRLNPDPAQPPPTFETFTELVDRRLQKWLVISVSNDASDAIATSKLEMTFSRKITWRDGIGNRV